MDVFNLNQDYLFILVAKPMHILKNGSEGKED